METLIAFAFVHLVAAASPGPNFFLVSGLSGRASRRNGVLAAIGITLSVIAWSSAAALGINIFLDKNPMIYKIIQYLGAAYLVWLGASMLRGASKKPNDTDLPNNGLIVNGTGAFIKGFLVNLGNPKTVAYYTSIFAVFVPHGSGASDLLQIVAVAAIVSCAWWCAVAMIFSLNSVRRGFVRISRWIDMIAGGAFILFGIKLATR